MTTLKNSVDLSYNLYNNSDPIKLIVIILKFLQKT